MMPAIAPGQGLCLLPSGGTHGDSLASPSPPMARGEHLKESVKLTRGDVKYSEILR